MARLYNMNVCNNCVDEDRTVLAAVSFQWTGDCSNYSHVIVGSKINFDLRRKQPWRE